MSDGRPRLERVLETALYYTDHERTRRFYGDVLGLRLIDSEPERYLFYRAGESVFLLFEARASREQTTVPPHGATGPGHTCFQAPAAEYEAWKTWLAERGVRVLREVRWDRGLSFYFHDPDDNVLEIANADFWPR